MINVRFKSTERLQEIVDTREYFSDKVVKEARNELRFRNAFAININI